MKSLVSDFRLAKYFITAVCKQYNANFVDLPVFFNETISYPEFRNHSIIVPQFTKLSKTIFAIIIAYLDNAEDITNYSVHLSQEAKDGFFKAAFALVRSYCNSTGVFFEAFPSEPIVTKLHRESLTWILIKDLICPIFGLHPKDLKVVCSKSGVVDAARYVTYEEVDQSHFSPEQLPFIFLNLEVKNPVVRAGFLLREAISAHGMCPKEVLNSIFDNQDLKDKFVKLVKLAMVKDEAVNEYFHVLAVAGELKQPIVKTAQFASETFNYLGLIEKMLEPGRGSDWTAYKKLQPLIDEMNHKIEKVKKETGFNEVPFDILLRIQGDDLSIDGKEIIQKMLSNDRIW